MYSSEAKVIPAVIPKSLSDLENSLEKISTFTNNLQIDVVDGKFVPTKSWPYNADPSESPEKTQELLRDYHFEVDLMVSDQLAAARFWIESGARALIFHLEGLPEPQTAIDLCRSPNVQIGFSISNDTPLDKLYPFVKDVDFVQLMGIATIGSQGQPFDSRVLERIVTLKSLYPELVISVDGSINLETIEEVQKAGADRFVVGSGILKANDPKDQFTKLLKITS